MGGLSECDLSAHTGPWNDYEIYGSGIRLKQNKNEEEETKEEEKEEEAKTEEVEGDKKESAADEVVEGAAAANAV